MSDFLILLLIVFIIFFILYKKKKEYFKIDKEIVKISPNPTLDVDDSPVFSEDLNTLESTENANYNTDINESQLMEMCNKKNTSPEESIHLLRLGINDLKNHVKPAFWNNDNICFYRMERIVSLNQDISINNPKDEDYYYPLSDILLFKNYNLYLKGDLSNNNTNNNNTNNNNTNNNTFEPSFSETPAISPEIIDLSLNNKNNKNIEDINQPGVDGLKIFIKNGKKPIAYVPTPTTIIPGVNGINLYIWEPLAPPKYVCLGSVCSFSRKPIVPNIDNCPIRCVPFSCLDEIQLSMDDEIRLPYIKDPYNLYQLSEGKFIKGLLKIPNQKEINLKNYNLNSLCDNIELDKNDKPMTIKLFYRNTNINGNGKPQNKLLSGVFNGVKGYFNNEFENFLINKPEIQLNDYPNNPPTQFIKSKGKRYIINSRSDTDDKVTLYLSLNQRAFAYNQLKGEEINKILASMINIHKISLRIYDNDFHLYLDNVELSQVYIFDPNKIDWKKVFIDPQLTTDKNKIETIHRGGSQYQKDPFNFQPEMDGFVKLTEDTNTIIKNY